MTLQQAYLEGGLLGVRGLQVAEGLLAYQKFTTPATASTTAYESAGVAGPNATTLTIGRSNGGSFNSTFDGTLAAGNPDLPRNVVITVTHATAVVAVSGTIYGLDMFNRPITEAWSVTASGTSKTFTGAKAFKRVDYVSVTAATDASADTVKIGTGVVLGLAAMCAIPKAVLETSGGTVVTNGVVVAASTATTADARGTYSPNSAPNGATTYEVVYFVLRRDQ